MILSKNENELQIDKVRLIKNNENNANAEENTNMQTYHTDKKEYRITESHCKCVKMKPIFICLKT